LLTAVLGNVCFAPRTKHNLTYNMELAACTSYQQIENLETSLHLNYTEYLFAALTVLVCLVYSVHWLFCNFTPV